MGKDKKEKRPKSDSESDSDSDSGPDDVSVVGAVLSVLETCWRVLFRLCNFYVCCLYGVVLYFI